MPRRVDILKRVVVGITIPIKALRVRRVGHKRISTYEATYTRQVVTGVHVDEAQVVVVAVAGVAAVGDGL
jgi:hypothetical protein